MDRLYICKECRKPKARKVKGKARKGKKLLRLLRERDDLHFKVVPCECIGKCKKGPNGLIMPGRHRVHHLSIRKIEAMASKR